eukprot:Nk52_evm3s805 gene=Nk52_evmTU3s805
MCDYKEEQDNEVEALQSMYPEEFTVIETSPFYQFSISIKPDPHNSDFFQDLAVCLNVAYKEQYPEEKPEIKIVGEGEITEENIEELEALIEEQMEMNLGMVMVFTIVSCVTEWLEELAKKIKDEIEEEEKRLADERDMARQREETPQFFGTALTKENFLEWREKFERELKAADKGNKTGKGGKGAAETGKGKLTGRQLFEGDVTMKDSDNAFWEEGDVDVDESLFEEDLSNLEIEGE